MNANRKADLQRKLAVAPVEKPPAGLAERIKTEIPKELRFDINRERDRFARSLRLSLAVAASVIVIISSAFLALRIMETAEQKPEAKPATIAIPHRIAPPPAAPPAAAPALNESPKNVVLKKVKQQKPAAAGLADDQRSRDAFTPKLEQAAPAAAASAPIAAAAAKTMQAVPFKDLSRDEKLRILKERLAHGADPKEIARLARDSGLNDFADELEKKKP